MALDPSEFTDREVVRFRKELQEQIEALVGNIRRIARTKGRAVEAKLSAAMARDLTRELEKFFGVQGDRIRAAVADALGPIDRDLKRHGIDPAFATAGIDTLRAQVGSALDSLEAIKEDTSGRVRAAILRMQRTNAPIADLEAEVSDALDLTERETVTLVDTTLMGADRGVSVGQGVEAGRQWFMYDGPLDDLTRPWCLPRVGRLFRVAELDEDENDTGPQPPSVYGGGWNCRHRWIPIDDDEARDWPRWRGRGYR